ncbi:putative ABC transporter B family member 8 [Hibiscus syriacus]|uniref:ABC transporter B family member 8 n=1 Tax=Hibiscus syriacus TaxID=106335 RepID=A0A6A3CQZ8_HIBSY|nr:putative ABC transporter B family member 8 [Hibiscus syriacus]
MGSPEKNGFPREKETRHNIFIIFGYADWVDVLLMIMGTIGAIGDGMSTNWLILFVSRIMKAWAMEVHRKTATTSWEKSKRSALEPVEPDPVVLFYSAAAASCVLIQEVGFFDSQEATTSEVIISVSKDTSLIQEVLSEKFPLFVMNTTAFISGLAFSAYLSWRLALVVFPTNLLLIIPGILYGKYRLYISKKVSDEYGKAKAAVEQALSSIKTVYSFTAERRIVERYSAIMDRAVKLGLKQGIAKGLAVGSTGISFAIWAFVAWYGSHLVMYKGESGGRVYTAGLCFILGGLNVRGALGVALADLKHITEATVAAASIFDSVDLEAGKTVALVGASRSGKSTAIALVQRFYDVNNGAVKIDGVDIRRLQLKWIRDKMGLVSQEHALFWTSIKENIISGKLDATIDEVMAAAMAANAHNFIRQLPQGYETKIGERGALLSGGKKQRIATARAIIKNPVMLLLDEATGALDSESETLVQNALDQASMGKTTLVVPRKLSTIRNADLIAVVDNGCIIEMGSHDDLMNMKNASTGRLSTAKSSPSPAFFATPLMNIETPKPLSHPPPSFLRLLSLNSPEWKHGLTESLSAIAFGAIQSVYALTVGSMISAFFATSHQEMQARIRTYALIFSLLTLLSFILNLIQQYSFAYMSERLTRRIRSRMLEKILSFEPAWFDEEKHSSGALCSSLSDQASMVKTLVVSSNHFCCYHHDDYRTDRRLEISSSDDCSPTSYNHVFLHTMTSDLARGSTAVASVLEILDRQSSIVPWSQLGGETGRKSGCGKPTVIGLIQRFYDVEMGPVRVDGIDIRGLDIQWYRRQMALVSQEPVLYSGTIRDNIVFGKLDASENEVVEAARAANAHEFISIRNRKRRERGVQLSGGQKQRIAIARAIIRNPIILLLDEVTSALDVQSEQVVLEALDRIMTMTGRTMVVIAHKLNTIKKSDSVAFVADGKGGGERYLCPAQEPARIIFQACRPSSIFVLVSSFKSWKCHRH